jgi:hypothetical protein
MTIYRLYGLLTARYRLDRDGFYLQWGLSRERAPLGSIVEVIPAEAVAFDLSAPAGFWWPGCITSQKRVQGLGTVELFTTRGNAGSLLLRTDGDRHWVISPADRTGFIQQFTDSTRLGSLERISPLSERPDFYTSRIWQDRLARILILTGLAVSLGLLGFLGVLAGVLPAQVPFGFDPMGAPSPIVPAGRLLLLPLIGGFCWIIDLALGAWFYRDQNDRYLAYGVWGVGIAVGLIMWGALFALLRVLDTI